MWWSMAGNIWIGALPQEDSYFGGNVKTFYTVWHIHRFYGDGHEGGMDKRLDGWKEWDAKHKGLMDTMLACQGNDAILPDSKWYWQKSGAGYETSKDFPTIESAKADAERDYKELIV